ncbi:hypothetical protein Trydic_g12228 [Trypoxylus dichotomus]
MAYQNEKITILYGSQTGNSQDLAERIWRESKRFFFTGSVLCMDNYNILELVSEKCVVFVCSTTGQGEEPDNMKNFWKFLLRKNLALDSLANLRYAVLGLGDSSYVKFNFAAKRLNKRLMQLGAQTIIPLGLGDDQHDFGYDAVADAWIESLWSNLLKIFPLPQAIQPLSKNSTITPRWNVLLSTKADILPLENQNSIHYSSKLPDEFYVSIKENIRTTAPLHFQDVRLIKFQTNGEVYEPGDVLCLRPKNLAIQVREFQKVLEEYNVGIKPDSVFDITEVTSEIPVPSPLRYKVTFQQLCEEYFDLTAIPRRYTFSILAQLTDSDIEKEKCLEFTTAEGQEDLYNYCNRPRRNIVEVLRDFPHATKNLNKELLFEILTPIKPRDFSIASSYAKYKNEIHILVAVVKYKTKLVKERLGLCSNYLADLKVGDKLSVWLKKGSFSFPKDTSDTVIMVGPGTGMAPFRNYIQERVAYNSASSENLILFFGCRGKNKDFHCSEEFLSLEKEDKLRLICAFSRDQENKVYVQHKIVEEASTIWNALKDKKAYIFVAGNSKNMPQEVRNAFVTTCVNHGNLSKEEAEKLIQEMERRNKYQTETWF